MTTMSTNRPATGNSQRPTAKELIAANVQALIKQLEQGHSEAFTAYLAAMNRPRRPAK